MGTLHDHALANACFCAHLPRFEPGIRQHRRCERKQFRQLQYSSVKMCSLLFHCRSFTKSAKQSALKSCWYHALTNARFCSHLPTLETTIRERRRRQRKNLGYSKCSLAKFALVMAFLTKSAKSDSFRKLSRITLSRTRVFARISRR